MNTENICETFDATIQTQTIDIPLRITMKSINDASFEFIVSIDELGQIILTPTTKDIEFTAVNTESNVEYDLPVLEQETVISTDDNLTIKETSILIRANMIIEEPGCDYSADVDEIGQVVIYPLKTKNTFVTATIEDSLNLITEELKCEEYFGYKLINNGDGWDIVDYTGNTVEEGVATINKAKIVVCKEELRRLESLVEDVNDVYKESEDTAESETQTDKEDPSDTIQAEIVDEAVTNVDKNLAEYDEKEINDALSDITDEFTSQEGAVKCDTQKEQSICVKILEQYYTVVNTSRKQDMWVVEYKQLNSSEETTN